jgi:hypothetical protein
MGSDKQPPLLAALLLTGDNPRFAEAGDPETVLIANPHQSVLLRSPSRRALK